MRKQVIKCMIIALVGGLVAQAQADIEGCKTQGGACSNYAVSFPADSCQLPTVYGQQDSGGLCHCIASGKCKDNNGNYQPANIDVSSENAKSESYNHLQVYCVWNQDGTLTPGIPPCV